MPVAGRRRAIVQAGILPALPGNRENVGYCGGDTRITARGGKRLGYYRCRDCDNEFTVRTGTIFERSHLAPEALTRISHQLTAADADLPIFAALNTA